jgi:serine/threonine protein kinase
MESSSPANSREWCPERFIIRNLIGQGAMGKVYRASDQMLNRDVAIKFLTTETAGATGAERFLREAKALAILDHPNIVRILSSGINAAAQPYFVMEYLDGESLASEVQRGPLSAQRFFKLASGVVAGLADAHLHKIAHRDLKPSNIICTKDNDGNEIYKIIDFGIARQENEAEHSTVALTRTNAILGSPAYMSPEQCRGQRGDVLSDIYSLGCIMFECVSGKPPFVAETALELMYKHMNLSPPPLANSGASPESQRLAALIARCLSKDASARPQGNEIATELAEIFSSPLEKFDLFTKRKEFRGKSENKPLLPLLSAGLVLVLVLGGLIAKLALVRRASPTNEFKTVSKNQRLARDIAALKAKPALTLDDLMALGRKQLESRSKSDLEGAEAAYTEALSRCGSTDAYADKRAACYTLKGKAEWMQGKIPAARKDFDEALRIATKVRLNSEIVRDIMFERALQHTYHNEFADALADFKAATVTGFQNSDQLSFPDKLDGVEELAQRLDKLGLTRVEMMQRIGDELRTKNPSNEHEKQEILRLANEVCRMLKTVAIDVESGAAMTAPLTEYIDRISRAKPGLSQKSLGLVKASEKN